MRTFVRLLPFVMVFALVACSRDTGSSATTDATEDPPTPSVSPTPMQDLSAFLPKLNEAIAANDPQIGGSVFSTAFWQRKGASGWRAFRQMAKAGAELRELDREEQRDRAVITFQGFKDDEPISAPGFFYLADDGDGWLIIGFNGSAQFPAIYFNSGVDPNAVVEDFPPHDELRSLGESILEGIAWLKSKELFLSRCTPEQLDTVWRKMDLSALDVSDNPPGTPYDQALVDRKKELNDRRNIIQFVVPMSSPSVVATHWAESEYRGAVVFEDGTQRGLKAYLYVEQTAQGWRLLEGDRPAPGTPLNIVMLLR